MRRIRYTKYNGDLASEIDLGDLLDALSDYFLDSGFEDPWSDFGDLDQDMRSLREALRRLLEDGSMFDEDLRKKLQQAKAQGKLDELIDKLIERMEQENYISSYRPEYAEGHTD